VETTPATGAGSAAPTTTKEKIMDNESESDKEIEFENRAPKLDPYGPVGTKEQERERVEVKASKIPGAGNGVFARFDFAKGDVVSEFLGKKCKTRDEVRYCRSLCCLCSIVLWKSLTNTVLMINMWLGIQRYDVRSRVHR
jgi:hypothetical protein